ncbi:right-handed parallel beta-helix repeat-containing protein [Thermodesulfobacteriota bacterium]
MRKSIFFSLAATIIFCSIPAFCDTIHIPADQPTIQAGIDAAVDGDLVFVEYGTFVENIDFLGKSITVRSEWGADMTAIDGDPGGCVVTFSSGENGASILDGFQIRNGYQNEGGGIVILDADPTIMNCRIQDNSASDAGGGIYCVNGDPTIMNCTISGNLVSQSTGVGGAMYCRQSSPRLTNCIISENKAVGFMYSGIVFGESCSPVITNCTIFGNGSNYSEDTCGILLWSNCTAQITNCIIWEDLPIDMVGLDYESSTVMVSYSDIKGGENGVQVCPDCVLNWLEGNIDADPRFVGSGNYHLLPSSPCINAGTDAGIYTDIDGNIRPQGGGFYMGAYESSGSCFLGLVM